MLIWHTYFLISRSNPANCQGRERAGSMLVCMHWFHSLYPTSSWVQFFLLVYSFLFVPFTFLTLYFYFFFYSWMCFLLVLPPYRSLASLSGILLPSLHLCFPLSDSCSWLWPGLIQTFCPFSCLSCLFLRRQGKLVHVNSLTHWVASIYVRLKNKQKKING